MNPIIDRLFLSSLKDSNIAIDTCCLIDSIKYKETVGKFLLYLKEIGAGIYTVPGVVFEFLDRLSIATFNLLGEIKNYGFYKINTDNYEKIAKNILKDNSK